MNNTRTLSIGDSYNDLPIPVRIDQSVLVQKPDGIKADIELSNIYKAVDIEPQG